MDLASDLTIGSAKPSEKQNCVRPLMRALRRRTEK